MNLHHKSNNSALTRSTGVLHVACRLEFNSDWTDYCGYYFIILCTYIYIIITYNNTHIYITTHHYRITNSPYVIISSISSQSAPAPAKTFTDFCTGSPSGGRLSIAFGGQAGPTSGHGGRTRSSPAEKRQDSLPFRYFTIKGGFNKDLIGFSRIYSLAI